MCGNLFISNEGVHLRVHVSPIYTPNMETLRACDIIITSSQGRGVAFCYIHALWEPIETL
jgi:hypothetical protein